MKRTDRGKHCLTELLNRLSDDDDNGPEVELGNTVQEVRQHVDILTEAVCIFLEGGANQDKAVLVKNLEAVYLQMLRVYWRLHILHSFGIEDVLRSWKYEGIVTYPALLDNLKIRGICC